MYGGKLALGPLISLIFFGSICIELAIKSAERSKDAELKVRLARREREYKRHHVPSQYKPGLDSPSLHWQVFYRQQDAFQFARAQAEELRVFSSESESFVQHSGQRLYVVATYEHFWHYYRQLTPKQRHHYELIPEGSVCHLYFDLEYSREHNPNRDGEQMVKTLIKYVCAQLKTEFDVTCDECSVLQLDACTEKKFSRHLLYRLRDTAFQDNIHAGNFVQHILSKLWDTLESTENIEGQAKVVRSDDSDLEPPVKVIRAELGDSSTGEVISCHSNGQESSSHGNQQKQERAGSDSTVLKDSEAGSPSLPGAKKSDDGDSILSAEFLEGANLTVSELRSLLVKDKNNQDVFFIDSGVYTKNRNFRLYLSCKLGRNNPLVLAEVNRYNPQLEKGSKVTREERYFLDSLITNVRYSEGLGVLTFDPSPGSVKRAGRLTGYKPNRAGSGAVNTSDILEGYQSSPYPEVDDFISQVIREQGRDGVIRRWTYFSQGELLLFDILRNRWCANIGRQHSSNNIRIVADLKKGVYYQKCHDPVCKAVNFKSDEQPLPKKVLPSFYFTEDMKEEQEVTFDPADDVTDDDLVLAANEMESSMELTDDELLQMALSVESAAKN